MAQLKSTVELLSVNLLDLHSAAHFDAATTESI